MFNIFIYHLDNQIEAAEYHLGRRVTYYQGAANWGDLVDREMASHERMPDR